MTGLWTTSMTGLAAGSGSFAVSALRETGIEIFNEKECVSKNATHLSGCMLNALWISLEMSQTARALKNTSLS